MALKSFPAMSFHGSGCKQTKVLDTVLSTREVNDAEVPLVAGN